MRVVRVRVGAPILPLTDGREGPRVTNLRERTYTSVAELLRSLGGQVPDVPLPSIEEKRDDAPRDRA
jgi:1-acyl-sn-glycerol-3-phosphate acyltransferase